jgi:hypothetical protein
MFRQSQIEAAIDAEIQHALETLALMPDKTSDQYGNLVEHISKLNKLKTEGKSKQISPDTMLIVAANIFGILWLARYERENVIRSRSAFAQVMRLPR